MKLTVLPDAVTEIEKYAEAYEKSRKGLGAEFTSEVTAMFSPIEQRPLTWPAVSAATG